MRAVRGGYPDAAAQPPDRRAARHVLPDGLVPGMRGLGGWAPRRRVPGAGARRYGCPYRYHRARGMSAAARGFEVVVIGGGPAGIMSAAAARRHGATVRSEERRVGKECRSL